MKTKIEKKKPEMIKYEKEIDNFLREVIFEDWMSESEYNTIVNYSLNEKHITKELLSEQLVIGIRNGYSIEDQFKIIKKVL